MEAANVLLAIAGVVLVVITWWKLGDNVGGNYFTVSNDPLDIVVLFPEIADEEAS